MKTSARVGLLAVASFASLALALALATRAEDVQSTEYVQSTNDAVTAHASLSVSAESVQAAAEPVESAERAQRAGQALLDAYAGRYRTADGVELLVIPENAALTLELPAELGPSPWTLHESGEDRFVAVDGRTRVTFDRDASGEVRGLQLQLSDVKDAIAGARKPFRRAVVTVEDIVTAADGSLAAIVEPN